eukprot:TRINITY_DN1067_c0_g1_i1.p1 TRINITY_DN1067_c0_g1~~TRINITY_DN1067_c0_g1_i1.p1  ORF type:complete len:193 (-),score=27.95 TRINITY_DN1067_c0_g1_i1:270-827(-)
MKFLTLPQLASCTSFIDGTDTGETIVTGKVECFSCKKAGADKHLYTMLENQYQEALSNKSPENSRKYLGSSPFGPMQVKRSRETLVDLISCLNSSYPDYDFSGVRSTQFVKEDLDNVVRQVNARLGSAIKGWNQIRDQIWTTIDREINLRECSIYSFNPEIDSNPFEDDGSPFSIDRNFPGRTPP